MNMVVLAAALAATALTAPKGKVYNDAPVVTNVTFEGLATTAEVTDALAPYATRGYVDAKVSDVAGTADMAWSAATTAGNQMSAHEGRADNPHGVTASQVGAVPTTRKVNGKALSSDVTLGAADVGAPAKVDVDAVIDEVKSALNFVESALSDHENNNANPHGVTAAQVGAYTKTQTDAAISSATSGLASALALKADAETVSSALAAKADKSALSGYATTAALAAKADASALAAKQDRPVATATAAALSLRADGAAISVAVAASGTLSASLADWTDGQAQTALISLAPGASVAAAVSLVGYGSWPTNRFVASCVRVGPRVYVTPITALSE